MTCTIPEPWPTVPCEGGGYPSPCVAPGMCTVCGRWPGTDPAGNVAEHRRIDLLGIAIGDHR